MGLRKGAGMEGDGGVVEGLPEEGLAVDELPLVAEDAVGGVGVKVKPDGVPEVVLEEGAAEVLEVGLVVEDEDELDFVGGAVDKELDVAEEA